MPVYFWKITYEIPPTRAIHTAYCDDAVCEAEVRTRLIATQPRAVIRTITKMPPADGGGEITEDRKDEP